MCSFNIEELEICRGERPVPILYRPYDRLINKPARNSIYHSIHDREGTRLDGFLISLLLEFLNACSLNASLYTVEGASWSNSNPNTSMVEIVS